MTDCPTCRGRGWIIDLENNMSMRCPDCDAWLDPTMARMVVGGFPVNWRDQSLDSYDTNIAKSDDASNAARAKAVNLCRLYVEEFNGSKSPWMVLAGPKGTGKTHLSVAVTAMIARRKFSVAWWSIADLQRRLKSEFEGDDKPATYEWRHDIANAKLLCLDDVGATIVSDWFRDEIIAAIDARYRSSRPVLITTNLNAQALADTIGDRSVDRILEHCRPFRFPEMKSFRALRGEF